MNKLWIQMSYILYFFHEFYIINFKSFFKRESYSYSYSYSKSSKTNII